MNAPDPSSPLLPEDSLDDPELGFGDEEEMSLEPAGDDAEISPEAEPMSLNTDANVPLDVEPDPDLSNQVEFTDNSPSLDAEGGEPGIDATPEPDADTGALELKSLQSELAGLQEERAKLLDKNRELNEKLDAAAPTGEISRLQGQLSESKKHHAEAEEEVKRLKGELEQAGARADKLESEQAEAEDSVPDETKKELDLMDAQISALQTENTQLKEALQEAQGAESRTEHAHDSLARKVKELESEVENLRSQLTESADKLDAKIKENEELGRELAVAKKAIADQRDSADEVERKGKVIEDRQAELDSVTKALAEARAEIERLAPFENEVARVEGLEDRITDLQESLVAKEKVVAELQEKLDSEAARSYRLSQRRIPALNAEVEQLQEGSRELERKLQKAELKGDTFEEKSRELEDKVADLQRALQGAKARAQDTAIVSAGETDPHQLVGDEVRRLTNRMHELEEERATLAASIRTLSDTHKSELQKHMARADNLESESDERYESLLKQRTQLRVLKERISGMLKLAEDLNSTAHNQRQPLLEALRKLADVPPDTN